MSTIEKNTLNETFSTLNDNAKLDFIAIVMSRLDISQATFYRKKRLNNWSRLETSELTEILNNYENV